MLYRRKRNAARFGFPRTHLVFTEDGACRRDTDGILHDRPAPVLEREAAGIGTQARVAAQCAAHRKFDRGNVDTFNVAVSTAASSAATRGDKRHGDKDRNTTADEWFHHQSMADYRPS